MNERERTRMLLAEAVAGAVDLLARPAADATAMVDELDAAGISHSLRPDACRAVARWLDVREAQREAEAAECRRAAEFLRSLASRLEAGAE
jgi:hypothetical protein